MSFYFFKLVISPIIIIFFFFTQRAGDLVQEMGQISYNIEEGLPNLVDHSKKLLGVYQPKYCLIWFVNVMY